MNAFTLYYSTPDVIKVKGPHIRKIGGKLLGGFHRDHGDIPSATMIEGEGKRVLLPVVNTRGRAYGLRNALRYRRNKKKDTRKD